MKPTITADDAYAVCEGIAGACAQATAPGAYGDGYRAAAERIVAEVRARRTGPLERAERREPLLERQALERELHDAEIEARTLARVVETAARIVEVNGSMSDAADALRVLTGAFFAEEDLPPVLRLSERSSGVRLAGEPHEPRAMSRAAGGRTSSRAGLTRRGPTF